jgi:hypothetical protein
MVRGLLPAGIAVLLVIMPVVATAEPSDTDVFLVKPQPGVYFNGERVVPLQGVAVFFGVDHL